jgi:hypothetical protein
LDPKLPTNRIHQDLALIPVGIQQADFDQAMGIQRPINFSEHRFRQTGSADHNHGLQGVGFGSERLTLNRR